MWSGGSGEFFELIETREQLRIMKKQIELLPEKQRLTLEMKLGGLNFKEIAQEMDCAYDTAKANYRHAVLKIRAQLKV